MRAERKKDGIKATKAMDGSEVRGVVGQMMSTLFVLSFATGVEDFKEKTKCFGISG